MNGSQALVDRYLADRSRAHRDEVIAAHLYLCKRGARKFRRAESEPADLEQVAAIGLVKATDAYRSERTTPFEAYAWIMIVGELMHYVRDSERAIRVPRALRSLDRRYLAAWERLAARNHAEPTALQLALELEVSLDVIEQLQAVRRSGWSPGNPCDGPRYERLTHDERALSLEDRITVMIAVEELDQRERIIVLGTYGSGLSQSELAGCLRLSQSQVSKLHSRALVKLSERVA
jgi:RNA polymerase sigma-B factor